MTPERPSPSICLGNDAMRQGVDSLAFNITSYCLDAVVAAMCTDFALHRRQFVYALQRLRTRFGVRRGTGVTSGANRQCELSQRLGQQLIRHGITYQLAELAAAAAQVDHALQRNDITPDVLGRSGAVALLHRWPMSR
jgi:hypothetical protein